MAHATKETNEITETNEIKNIKGETFIKTQGTVKSFNKETGYGFIFTIDEPDADVYVHATQIITEGKRELDVGDEVEFIYKQHENGFRAYEVKKIFK